jgi:hypothetical protein
VYKNMIKWFCRICPVCLMMTMFVFLVFVRIFWKGIIYYLGFLISYVSLDYIWLQPLIPRFAVLREYSFVSSSFVYPVKFSEFRIANYELTRIWTLFAFLFENYMGFLVLLIFLHPNNIMYNFVIWLYIFDLLVLTVVLESCIIFLIWYHV